MNCLVLKVKTQMSTFRMPEFQNYHKSFFLPPPTTLMGFAGAALGLCPRDAQDFFLQQDILFGISGQSQGKTDDLWKINAFNGESSVLKRELLYGNTFYIVFSSENPEPIDRLKQAFLHPGYALTLGSSDSLAKVRILDQWSLEESEKVAHCMVEDDILEKVLQKMDNGMDFSIYSISDPIAYDLPVRFQYKEAFGPRQVIGRKTYSFIGKEMTLNFSLGGIRVKSHFIPLNRFQ